MCGIFGASFAPGSRVSRRRLMKALFEESEVRGTDAAGFAFFGADGSDGLFKKDVRGGQLSVSTLPHNAASFIGHTRNSTHGDPKDNDNNHPIESPSGDIRLVHNGVITNHREVRQALGKDGKKLPDVDSSVIPAVIEVFGLEHTDMLRGYAACAWYDRETGGTIHVARFESSPVTFTTLVDGTVVFASTPAILAKALLKVGIKWIGDYPDTFSSMREEEYFQLLDGEFVLEGEVTFGAWDSRGSQYYGTTSGRAGGWTNTAKSVTATPTTTNPGKQPVNPTPGKGSEDSKPMALGPTDKDKVPNVLFSAETVEDPAETHYNVYGVDGTGWTDEDYAHWLITGEEPDEKEPDYEADMAIRDGVNPVSYEEYIAAAGDPDYGGTAPDTGDAGNTMPLFYSRTHDGDYQDYTNIETLLSALRWHAGLSGSEELLVGPEEGELRWINHFEDIGYLSDDPDGNIEFSWVHTPSNFEGWAHMLPGFVKDGCSKLRTMVGA